MTTKNFNGLECSDAQTNSIGEGNHTKLSKKGTQMMRRRQFLQDAVSLGAVAVLQPGVNFASGLLGNASPLTETALPATGKVSEAVSASLPARNITRCFDPLFSVAYEDIDRYMCSDDFDWYMDNPREGTPRTWVAAVRGNWEDLERCLNEDPSSISVIGNLLINADGSSGGWGYCSLPLIHVVTSWPDKGKALLHVISRGADVNAYHESGTPLHFAVRWSPNIETLGCLVSAGADIEAKDKFGCTPLYDAVKYGDLEMVKYLISEGADVHAKRQWGSTMLDVAHTKEVKRFLRERMTM